LREITNEFRKPGQDFIASCLGTAQDGGEHPAVILPEFDSLERSHSAPPGSFPRPVENHAHLEGAEEADGNAHAPVGGDGQMIKRILVSGA
jgi:hypothetical protein